MHHDKLATAAAELDEPLRLVDIGCRGGPPAAWAELGAELEILAFDADNAACEQLAEIWSGPGTARFLPVGLAESERRGLLHLTADPACASLFPPVAGIWERYPQLQCVRPTGTAEVELSTLDAATRGFGPLDVVKLDVQGAEALVLQGAARCLPSARAIDIEVTFEPIYEGQALFGDVDSLLRRAGFVLCEFESLVHYRRHGDEWGPPKEAFHYFDSEPEPFAMRGGQLFWAQAKYANRNTFDPPSAREACRDALALAAVGLSGGADASLRRAARI